jgi:hypothetical protein
MKMKTMAFLIGVLLTISVSALQAQTISQMMMQPLAGDGDDLNIPSFLTPDQTDSHEKSKFLALGLSMLLPGAGQYYTESKSRMIIFGSAEAAIWSGFFGLRAYGGWKKDDYRAWAAYHANADVNGKSDYFFEKMTYYNNLAEFNQLELVYEGNQAVIFPETPEYYWNWDSRASREHFRELRNQSKNAYQRSLILVGVAVVNRLLSGIDAYRAAHSFSQKREFGAAGWNVYYSGVPGITRNFKLGIVQHF